MKPIRRLMKKFLQTSLFAAQSFCLGAAFQSDMTNYAAFKQFSSPESAYSFSSFKQFPVLFDGENPVLPDAAFYRELRAVAGEALRPETPAERFYEAYVWREKADGVYASLEKQTDDLADLTQTLNEEQWFMRALMRLDYETLLGILKRMESGGPDVGRALASYADFLAREAADVRLMRILTAADRLQETLSEYDETAFDESGDSAAQNMDVLESAVGRAQRAVIESEAELERGTFLPQSEDVEKFDFFN